MRLGDGGVGTALLPFKPAGLACVDLLNRADPDAVLRMHRAYAVAGARLLTSNTFCCDADSLASSGLRPAELACAGARLARQVADAFPGTRVAGSIGPGWRFPSRGEVAVETLIQGYTVWAEALLTGGADLLWIETVQDPLQAEAAVAGCRQALNNLGRQVPLALLLSLSADGNLIGGQALPAVLARLLPLRVDILGFNCSRGPAGLEIGLGWLRQYADCLVACFPNAGIDAQVEPTAFAAQMLELYRRFAPELMGGCCGTGPAHIAALAEALKTNACPEGRPRDHGKQK